MDPALPAGTRLIPLTLHADDRGGLVELFRREWDGGVEPVQWNFVSSRAGVLRGVHVHRWHEDYLVVPAGHAVVGLRDIRPGSPTNGLATFVELDGERPAALVIPTGVAHGFYFPVPSTFVYGVTKYFDPHDELGCHWADPDLGLTWPAVPTLVSPRDRALPPLRDLLRRLDPAAADRTAARPLRAAG